MSMLSDRDILAMIQGGELGVEPFTEAQLRPAGLTLRLGSEILVPKPVALIDVRKQAAIEYSRHEMRDDEPFILQPQAFVLGHTLELVTVGHALGFFIEGRSTMARLGVSIEQSASVVDTGVQRRPITLEIYNCGPSPVTLYAGMDIARVVVFRLSSEASHGFDEGHHYAAQKAGVGKPIFKNQ